MRRIYFLFYLLIFFAFAIQETHANPADPFFFQHYDNRNGLSNSSINHIYTDAGNLLWVATWDGLNMYDGTSFHIFNYNKENDFKSIGSNVIRYITEDKAGNIWISTIEGVTRYEKHSGRFYNYFYDHLQHSSVSEQEYNLAIDNDGRVYCLNQKSGLTIYDAKSDTFRSSAFPTFNSGISQLAFDEKNRLLILTDAGELSIYSVKQNQLKKIHSYIEKKGILNFFIVNEKVFFNTRDRLFVADNTNFSHRIVLELKLDIRSMIYYKNHYLLAWAENGFSVFDNEFRVSSFLNEQSRQMNGTRITSWSLGIEDILWFGTDGNGIIKVYPKTKSFGTIATSENGLPYNRPVRAFCNENENLWVGTKGSGIIKVPDFWTSSTLINKQFFLAPAELDNNSVYALTKGNDDLIYIGSDGKGIAVFDLKTKKFNKWSQIKGYNAYPEFGSVYSIFQEKDNSLWLGTSGYGLIHLKISRENSGQLSLLFLERFIFNNSDTGPANDIIYSLAPGDENHLWIGCRYGGLSLLDKTTRRFKTFKAFSYEGSLSNNDVLSIFKDSRNRLWIGTSYGLNWIKTDEVSKESPPFQKLTTADGLPNNTIHAIEEDGEGNIWVSTNKGLAKLDQEDLKISYYQQSDGLQSNEFCDGAVWKDKTGVLFFGGTYGFNYFLPQKIKKTGFIPNLLLSGISIGGKNVNENGFIIINHINKDPLDFSIDRNDNFFEIDAKAISFLNAEKCEYAYYLEGYDKTWHYAGTSGKIAYSNISPGNYSLKLKWSNGDGLWTKEMSFFNLGVKQYLWLTPYAFLTYAIIAFLLVFVIYTNHRNRLQAKHRLAVEHVLRTKEVEIHQNRLGFFTNIAHELQTPLTLIMGSIERFLEKPVTDPGQKGQPNFLSLIHQQASRLTYLVHQLLEFRKVESGFLKNQYQQLNISGFLNNLAEPFIHLGEQNALEYEVNISPGIKGWVDKDKLEKIIFNLLSNAFKYSSRNEKIVFSARENILSNELEIAVANSGNELPQNQLDKIFDKFYVAGAATHGSEKFGTGIGLAFTRQLVTSLNGRINANSESGWITFNVYLPLAVEEEEIDSDIEQSSDMPSSLFLAVTAYNEGIPSVTSGENNKIAILDDLHEEKLKNILVVEDDAGIRYLLNDILKGDYIVYEAEDGQEALELIGKIIPDIVISDVMMPNMNGLELCNKMKNTPATCQVPFILLSARGSEDHHMEGYEVGADAYIAKPFHTAYLKLRIRKLLEYRQMLHELFNSDGGTDLLSETDIADSDKAFLTKLVQLIEEKIDETELNAVFIEKAFAISKMQLFRKLKTLTGMTPGEFIKNTRLRKASQLLLSTNLTVSEIFYRTGFNNQSYFFREFKKRYNYAPNEYREKNSIRS